MGSCFKNMKKNRISNLEDIFEPRPEGFTEPVSILKNGKMLDKAMRMPNDQNNEEYKKTLKSKGEVSGFAKRKQGSPSSGASEKEDKS